jgi:glycosyltransferase involved in cell wall biosynthesis
MKTIPTGIDSSEIRPSGENIEYPSVFHIGALDWLPNQEGLIWFLDHVWTRIHQKFPTVRFYIAGRNAPAFIRELRYPNLVFLGEVENAYRFMDEKAVMVVPLLSGSGMRIKIIEGMALGKAVLTTPIGTEGIATTHGENIMIAGSEDEFVHSLSLLLSDFSLYQRIGNNALVFVRENFDNLAIASGLMQFYETHMK